MEVTMECLSMSRTKILWKVMSCLALVVIADLLFYGYPDPEKAGWLSIGSITRYSGWTTGLFVMIVTLFTAVHTASVGKIAKPLRIIILSSMMGLAVSCVIEPSLLAFSMIFAGIPSIAMLHDPGWRGDVRLWVINLVNFFTRGVVKIFPDMKSCAQAGLDYKKFSGLIYWTVPAVLSALFILLFSLANPIISDSIEYVAMLVSGIEINFDRVIFWSLVAVLSWPLVHPKGIKLIGCVLGVHPGKAQASWGKHFDLMRLASKSPIAWSLVLFNAIFLVQTSMDFTYLWGGKALPDGFTYAEYAHRGAYPLIATALLAGAFVFIAFSPGSESEKSPFVRGLVYSWIAQNLILVFSSIWRTLLYVEVYSLSVLRVSAVIWMGLVAAGLVWLLVRVIARKPDVWLININALTLLVVLYTCCFLNIRGLIADYNVRHCIEVAGRGRALDIDYLVEMGPASIPALTDFRDNRLVDEGRRKEAETAVERLRAEVDERLKSWRGWTIERHRLSRYVGSRPGGLGKNYGSGQ